MKIEVLYILFWIYAIAGYLMEVIRVFIREKKFVNRGFFLGPYCPIYGVGGVLLSFLSRYQRDPFIIFSVSIIICSFVEYMASYILELIFKVRWWDYSDRFMNVNGRICLVNTIGFGILGMIIVCFLNPLLINYLTNFNPNLRHVIALVLLIVTTLDIIITITILLDIRKTITNYKNKTLNLFKPGDNTEEVSKRVKSILKNKSFLHQHMLKAYDNLKIYKDNFLQKTEDLIKYKRFKHIENMFMLEILISIIIGLIIYLITRKVRRSICIALIIEGILFLITRSKNEK